MPQTVALSLKFDPSKMLSKQSTLSMSFYVSVFLVYLTKLLDYPFYRLHNKNNFQHKNHHNSVPFMLEPAFLPLLFHFSLKGKADFCQVFLNSVGCKF